VTAAQSLLHRGLARLRDQHGEPFTIAGLNSEIFTGMYEETRRSNTVGEGGFIPAANAVLHVQRAEVERLGIAPWLGMKVGLNAREFLVTDISDNRYRWTLSMMVAHPKGESDVAAYVKVLSGGAGTIVFGSDNNPIIPTA